LSIAEIGVGVPPHHTRTITQRRKGKEARLSAEGIAPLPKGVLETAARNRRVLSYQAGALIRLIDDLLKGDTKAIEADAAAFPDLRLPGDNPDDALRYLLRGLRNELRTFDDGLAALDGGTAGLSPALGPLRQLALAVAQVFAGAPDNGAGHGVVSMIGNILDQSGLMAWRDFLGRFGGSHAEPWAEVALGATEVSGAEAQPAASAASHAPREAAKPAEPARPRAAAPAPIKPAPKPAPAPRKEPAAGTEDPLEIPLILVRPDQGDWARVLFKRGLAYLTKVYGEPPEKLRPLLGDWVARSGDDHQKVFRLLAKAQTQREPDPKGWVSKVLTEGSGAPSPA
jgi:cell division septation protein DedD